MKFRDVIVGEAFEFKNHQSGSPYGPWIKLSSRSYYRPSDVHDQKKNAEIYKLKNARFLPHKVGTINVEVEPVTIDDALKAEIQLAAPLMIGKFLKGHRQA